ncbi:MAG: hypothetical protein RMI91_06575 [Gemmatales bacterium]|nr:hypothetical protein [Gemmatales bacterium]
MRHFKQKPRDTGLSTEKSQGPDNRGNTNLPPGSEPITGELYLEIIRLPKLGHSLKSCDDAWAFFDGQLLVCAQAQTYEVRPLGSLQEPAGFSVAVSDGASDSFDSGSWARLLTQEAVCEGTFRKLMPIPSDASKEQHRQLGFIATRLRAWTAELAQVWRQQYNGSNLPWYLVEKLEQGAHATLLVAEFLPSGPRRSSSNQPVIWTYRVLAIGDNCLFHFRKNRLHNMIPNLDLDQFGNTPYLIATREDYNEQHLKPEAVNWAQGQFLAGDEIWIATDALSAWIARRCRNGNNNRPDVPVRLTEQFFHDLRERRQIRNDDITFLRVYSKSPSCAKPLKKQA